MTGYKPTTMSICVSSVSQQVREINGSKVLTDYFGVCMIIESPREEMRVYFLYKRLRQYFRAYVLHSVSSLGLDAAHMMMVV